MSLLVDTTVLIDALRGKPEAARYIASLGAPPFVSVVTAAELYAGVRDGPERRQLEFALAHSTLLEVSLPIGIEAGLLKRLWARSHGLGLADALIAATAMRHGLDLATLNRKHFPMIAGLVVPY